MFRNGYAEFTCIRTWVTLAIEPGTVLVERTIALAPNGGHNESTGPHSSPSALARVALGLRGVIEEATAPVISGGFVTPMPLTGRKPW